MVLGVRWTLGSLTVGMTTLHLAPIGLVPLGLAPLGLTHILMVGHSEDSQNYA